MKALSALGLTEQHSVPDAFYLIIKCVQSFKS